MLLSSDAFVIKRLAHTELTGFIFQLPPSLVTQIRDFTAYSEHKHKDNRSNLIHKRATPDSDRPRNLQLVVSCNFTDLTFGRIK